MDWEVNNKKEYMMKKRGIKTFLYVLLIFCVGTGYAFSEEFEKVPVLVKGMVTMIDLGAKKCIPCKMMAPILEKMEKNYKGKAAIIFIDVWKNRDQAGRFGIRAIPTQIFFNKEGKEVYRHVGFMGETAIIEQLKKMGVKS
ncbi:MAG: thioredoxin family protein [Deltaproteobacteria bacterium]|jgi:thioredoxin 1|nr:thioredoxin family protein [Deltaproteobacteria bacterium]